MEYRCVATSIEEFVRQLAVAYITHGYWFYVAGTIPEGKDPAAVDAKLIDRYGIAISKWARCRRKKQGLANMQYLRHGRYFVLLATKGRHEFFERERTSIRDVRRASIKFAGYSIGCRKGRDGRWHVSVRIDTKPWNEFRSSISGLRLQRSDNVFWAAFGGIASQQFAPIRNQMLCALRAFARASKTVG